jgi:LacI family transcriptional regulator
LLVAADMPAAQRGGRRHLIKIDCPLVVRRTVRQR